MLSESLKNIEVYMKAADMAITAYFKSIQCPIRDHATRVMLHDQLIEMTFSVSEDIRQFKVGSKSNIRDLQESIYFMTGWTKKFVPYKVYLQNIKKSEESFVAEGISAYLDQRSGSAADKTKSKSSPKRVSASSSEEGEAGIESEEGGSEENGSSTDTEGADEGLTGGKILDKGRISRSSKKKRSQPSRSNLQHKRRRR